MWKHILPDHLLKYFGHCTYTHLLLVLSKYKGFIKLPKKSHRINKLKISCSVIHSANMKSSLEPSLVLAYPYVVLFLLVWCSSTGSTSYSRSQYEDLTHSSIPDSQLNCFKLPPLLMSPTCMTDWNINSKMPLRSTPNLFSSTLILDL